MRSGPIGPYTESATILAVRQDYDRGLPISRIVLRHGVSDNTVRRWRARFGWPMRQVQPTGKVARRRKAGTIQASNDATVKRWRCCDRINTGPQCETCGVTPEWAKAS